MERKNDMSDENKDLEETGDIEESEELEEISEAEEEREIKANKKKKEDKSVKGRAAAASSTSKKKTKGKNRIVKWFREMRSELKKVIWPTRKQIVQNTTISLVIMAAAAILVWCIDNVGAQIVRAILSIAGK